MGANPGMVYGARKANLSPPVLVRKRKERAAGSHVTRWRDGLSLR